MTITPMDAPALNADDIRHRAICDLFDRLDASVRRLAAASERLYDVRLPRAEASTRIVEARGNYRLVSHDVKRIIAQALHDAEAVVIHDLEPDVDRRRRTRRAGDMEDIDI